MPGILSAPGLGLPLPQNLYPSALGNSPYDFPSNYIALNPGNSVVLPRGRWMVGLGQYSMLQILDPITGIWNVAVAAGMTTGMLSIESDGFSFRVANLLGCPVGAVSLIYGSSYVQASTTITAVGNNSTWLPVVGGQCVLIGGTLVSNGAGYGVPPLVLVAPPPPAASNSNGVGGVPCRAYATVGSGTVSGISFTNPGAGYPVAPSVVILPSPFDPNLVTGITQATASFSLTGSGSITAALCTNSGSPVATPSIGTAYGFSLVVAGAGTTGSISGVILQTCTALSVTGQGTGYFNGSIAFTTVGGSWPAGSITNSPESLGIRFRPRPAQIYGVVTGSAPVTLGTQVGTIIDGGLFASLPLLAFPPIPATAAGNVPATISLQLGTTRDEVYIQPA